MFGITTKNITNANGIKILKGEKVQCLFITELGNNCYEGLFSHLNSCFCNLCIFSLTILLRKG